MERRGFLRGALGSGMLGQTNVAGSRELLIERPASGQPHAGKVLALITPHLDDGPIFAGGTIAKLLSEGYTGYLIRTSNDEKDSLRSDAWARPCWRTSATRRRSSKTLGLKQVFDLSYRNHRMDDVARIEFRARLIFLFRLLKVDTVFSYDPWGHYEENPDHYVTAQAVEAACWMAGGNLDLPEHFAAGLKPHGVSEKYYFARGPQLVNRVVDISATMTRRWLHPGLPDHGRPTWSEGPEDSLADRKLKLPALDGSVEAANAEYMKMTFEDPRCRGRPPARARPRRRVPLHRPRPSLRRLHHPPRRPPLGPPRCGTCLRLVCPSVARRLGPNSVTFSPPPGSV